MNDSNDVMISIYNTLLQLRYPHITNAESKDVEATILSGENRICLLSWLLTQKISFIAIQLEKLKDTALEDKLFEYYSQIGICNNKDLLLGKCSLKEQLPILRLLLDFMKKVHVEPFTSTNETEEKLLDIVKLYIDDTDQTLSCPTVKTKLNYTEANKYFEENEKELLSDNCTDIKNNFFENSYVETTDRLSNEEQSALFDKEKEKFIEAFQTVSSWSVQPRNLDKDITDSISSDIKSICTNFFTLKKILQAKHEILNMKLAKGIPKTVTPLNAIIENIVIYNEELENLSMTNDSTD